MLSTIKASLIEAIKTSDGMRDGSNNKDALRRTQEHLYSKNFYAFNPSFDKKYKTEIENQI